MKSTMNRFSIPKGGFAVYSIMALALCGVFCPPAPAQNETTDPYQALVKRDYGTASNELAAIEQEIQDAKPEQYSRIEDRLRAALAKTDGKLRVGIINTIGDRGDSASLDVLAGLLKNEDELAARAAFNA